MINPGAYQIPSQEKKLFYPKQKFCIGEYVNGAYGILDIF